ncbi:RrF2 family transcriptional regulator [Collinsella provencensis]|uniref:RrF2 family transcriptional regulator n=1 Tax=Collinsella provencensis TaxID=1937461 RepID=UPI000C82F979|nr:RrF2 family transcriptional regulator [Collinsella provencensis]
MLVSTKGRYALRVMVDLAEHDDEGRIPLKNIAERQGISEKYLENILSTLVRNGLLSGMRGKGGGYRLTRSPEEFTVGEILRLTEGSLSPVACLDGAHKNCPHAEACRTIGMWTKLDEMISGYLDGVRLADLMVDPAACATEEQK